MRPSRRQLAILARRCPRPLGARPLSDEATEPAEPKGRVMACVPTPDRRAYAAALRDERRAWRAAELARVADTAAEEEAERARLAAAKAAKREVRAARAAESAAAQAAAREEAKAARRARLGGAVAGAEAARAARRARQANLVAALEAESALWLVDDDAIDAKITEELFAEPGSTGLVTAESHFYWRYAAVVDADVGKGRPPPEDLALLKADAAKAEAARVATTTERLMRTQAAHLTEYHAILDDAADIADAIQDLEVQVMKPRPFVKRGPK